MKTTVSMTINGSKQSHDVEPRLLLVHYIRDAREELFNLRFRHATGELENTSSIKEAKKALARGLTIANQRNLDVNRELQRG